MLIHPFMLHARGKNLGSRGAESVRFMCHPAVPLKNGKLNVGNGGVVVSSSGLSGGEDQSQFKRTPVFFTPTYPCPPPSYFQFLISLIKLFIYLFICIYM
jgi:hypothetical protein